MKNEAPGWFRPAAALIIAIGATVGRNFLDPILNGVFPDWSPSAVSSISSVLAAFAFALPLYLIVRWRHWTK